MSVEISVSFSEIGSSLYKAFNRRSEQYYSSELKEAMRDYIKNIQIPEE